MSSRLHILQHSLGLDQYGGGNIYRRHFVTGPGSVDYDNCCALVEGGLMYVRPPSEMTGGDPCFIVTQAGIDFVAKNSPDAPVLSRSQQTYRRFLAAESSLSFREWLTRKPRVTA